MKKVKNTQTPPLVTFVADPFALPTIEVSDAQVSEDMSLEDTALNDTDFDDTQLDDMPEIPLEKIAQAMAEQEAQEPPYFENNENNAQAILESQIQEDQALQAQLIQEAQELQKMESSSPFTAQLDAYEIQSCLEALLFLSDKPLSLKRFEEMLSFAPELISLAIESLKERYQAVHHGIELIEVAGGYQFRTKPGRMELARKLAKVQTQRLSTGAMETLAIIAYKQPVMKEDIDKIRGVDSSYFVRGLMEKKLIHISGRSELPGRPMLYSTGNEFLEIFGLKDLSSLPSLRELEQMIPGSQSKNPEEEDPRILQLRKLVGAMKADPTAALHYNPEEDEKILKEIRERVSSIPSSTPYLDELKNAEILTAQLEKQKEEPEEVTPTEPMSSKP